MPRSSAPSPAAPPPPRRVRLQPAGLLLAGVLALAAATPAPAVLYFVDAVAGEDTMARDGLTPGTAWKTITHALTRVPAVGSHELFLLAGEYGEASGEELPIILPANLSVRGSGPGLTILLDTRTARSPTIGWDVVAPDSVGSSITMRDLSVVRRTDFERAFGIGVSVRAEDTTAGPVLTNVIVTGNSLGLDLVANAYSRAAANTTVVRKCSFTDGDFGILGIAYTTDGSNARLDPVITNTVLAGNRADGAFFETGAYYSLSAGDRTNATSAPVLTHDTLSGNLGNGVVLYSSNFGYRAGPVTAEIRNSILSDNGDYSVFEDGSNTDATTFTYNMIGGLQIGLYLDEGRTELLTLPEVNAAVGSATNIEGVPAFVQGIVPDWNHLRADSDGVEAAEPGVVPDDRDGQPRPSDTDGDGTAAPEIGADEVPNCAVTPILEPAMPEDLCGPDASMVFDASASVPTVGFDCSAPLEFEWFKDGEPIGTGPAIMVTPGATATYTVVVSCPDFSACRDASSATVVVNHLPVADAGGPYEACVAWDAPDVTVPMLGIASVEDAEITGLEWTASTGVLTGALSPNPQLTVTNDGTNQTIDVTFTATSNHGCMTTASAVVNVWRGPQADAGGPYFACQDLDSPDDRTRIPLVGAADVPAGSAIVSWEWETSVGLFENDGTANPSLVLRNVENLTRTAIVTLTVTDDHGCVDEVTTEVTLAPSPTALTDGPYQQVESGGGTTSFPVDGSLSSGGTGLLTYGWTTDLGTFQSTGTAMADGVAQVLDILETGMDQQANVCLTVTDESGCSDEDCTIASVRTSPIQPPNDVGATFLVRKVAATVRLRWLNSPLDATHDLPDTYAIWESSSIPPSPGTWAPRAGLEAIPRTGGATQVFDGTLRDITGTPLLHMKVVATNTAGDSCDDPAADLPNCP